LPWLLGGAALVVYLLTLHHWISFSGLFELSRSFGWVWQPDLVGPVSWLAALVFRILPVAVRPVAMNACAAVCGALSLVWLARSVALWPHDRTHDQRQRERGPFWFLSVRTAWLPPVVAVLVCGLQLTFWEHATKPASAAPPWGSGFAMLDLLMFAYIVRSLLEFRISQKELWLYKSAIVYGLAITNNWAMLLYFPIYFAALIWIRGLAFFDVRFLVRMFLWGLLGLSLYLLLPIAQSATEIAHVPFWAGLRQSLGVQKAVIGISYNVFSNSRQDMLLLALSSIVPLLLIAIRWAAYFGDTSRLGVGLTTWAFHIVHAVFLGLILWMALDPPFGTRAQLLSQAFGLPFLTTGYIGALVVGYLFGYFLLIFSPSEPLKRSAPAALFVGRVVTGLIWVIAIISPVLLVAKNLPYIRSSNSNQNKQYARALAGALPTTNTVVLSDDARRIALLRGELASQHLGRSVCLVDTGPLGYADYQRFLKRVGAYCPIEPAKGSTPIADVGVLDLLLKLGQTNALYYLHPSFGLFFERFYLRPQGALYELARTPTNTLAAPLLSRELIDKNIDYWARVEQQALQPIAKAVDLSVKNNSLVGQILAKLHIKPEANREQSVIGFLYSRAENYWGVELQKNEDWKRGGQAFDSALKLNPDNVVAQINLACNRDIQAGRKPSTNNMSSNLADEFGKYRNWEDVMGENGPFDEPRFCFQEGMTLRRNQLLRQAAQQFARTAALEPDHLFSRLWLSQGNIEVGLVDEALPIVKEIRANPSRFGLSASNQNEVLFVESSAYLAKRDLPTAEKSIESALAQAPKDVPLYEMAKELYMKYGYYSNAISIIDREYRLNPTNTDLLLGKGFAYRQVHAYQPAIEIFTRVMKMETNNDSQLYNFALLDRAASYLESGKYDEARKDYEALEKKFPKSNDIRYGLGELAYRKKDTNGAVRYFQLYLANSPGNPSQAREVREKLNEIRPGYPQVH